MAVAVEATPLGGRKGSAREPAAQRAECDCCRSSPSVGPENRISDLDRELRRKEKAWPKLAHSKCGSQNGCRSELALSGVAYILAGDPDHVALCLLATTVVRDCYLPLDASQSQGLVLRLPGGILDGHLSSALTVGRVPDVRISD